MYPVPTQLICSITPILTIGYITFLRGNLGLRNLGFEAHFPGDPVVESLSEAEKAGLDIETASKPKLP